jgi:hypothetical protein
VQRRGGGGGDGGGGGMSIDRWGDCSMINLPAKVTARFALIQQTGTATQPNTFVAFKSPVMCFALTLAGSVGPHNGRFDS